MMMWDKKKAITTIMAKKRSGNGDLISGPTPMKPEVVKDDDGDIDGRHVATQDMLAGIHEKSAEKVMGALINFLELHGSHSGGTKDTDE